MRRSRTSLGPFAQYFGNCASRARSFMKINSRRTPLVSCVLHQNLLREEPRLDLLRNTSETARSIAFPGGGRGTACGG